MKFLDRIFSVKNDDSHLIFNFLGIRLKFKYKTKFTKLNDKKYSEELLLEEKEYIITKQFIEQVGYKPNLKNPKSFNEKIQWLKLHYHDPLITKCADKYLVREYVKDKIGEEFLIPLLGVYDTPEEINFDNLPEQFVIKVNWGWAQNIIVKDKSQLNIEETKEKLYSWLKPESNHYFYSFEWSYKNIKPKIIIESFIQQINNDLYDYKFLCYNGICKNLFIVSDRFKNKYCDFYDSKYTRLPFKRVFKNSPNGILKPANFDTMLALSEKLAKDFPFVRIDFYNVEGKIYLGELTFSPGNGMEAFTPIEWDYKFGNLIDLKQIKREYIE